MSRKAKIIYPALERWMKATGTTPALMMQRLYLTPEGYRNRMHGRTPFTGLELEKLEEMTGIPKKYLTKEGEA